MCNADFTMAGYPGPAVLNNSLTVLPSAIRYMTPNTVTILGLTAITSAVMSSVDSSMLSASTMVTQNVYRNVLRPGVTIRGRSFFSSAASSSHRNNVL